MKEEERVIKSREELEEFSKYLLENPFSPNKVKYEGLEYAIINGKAVDLNNSKINIIEDYYHPNHWIYAETIQTVAIYKIVDVKFSKNFDIQNAGTYVKLVSQRQLIPDGKRYASTEDLTMYDLMSRKIITALNGELRSVQHTELEMESFGFMRGKVNTDYWFHKSELNYIDTMLPYKKFDNTFYKIDIESYERELIEFNNSPQQVKEAVGIARKNNIMFGVDSPTYKAFEGIRYTFGVEIETCIGRLDPVDYKNLNVKAVHDGSLRDDAGNTPGGEYVSGILTGDAGLTQLAELCRILSLKCKLNEKCGTHVHCGNLNWNKEDICFSYILAEQLEDELFSILPKSRRSNSYCRRLTQLTLKYLPELRETRSKSQYDILIDRIYNDIFKEVTYVKGKKGALSINNNSESNNSLASNGGMNRSSQHPDGAKCGYDKSSQRYCWLNFVTLLYNTKGLNGSNTLRFGA